MNFKEEFLKVRRPSGLGIRSSGFWNVLVEFPGKSGGISKFKEVSGVHGVSSDISPGAPLTPIKPHALLEFH